MCRGSLPAAPSTPASARYVEESRRIMISVTLQCLTIIILYVLLPVIACSLVSVESNLRPVYSCVTGRTLVANFGA